LELQLWIILNKDIKQAFFWLNIFKEE
jgi:hypothetical protein